LISRRRLLEEKLSMHLGNGAITPECAALTYTAAAAGLVAGAATIRKSGLTLEKLQLAAGLGCFVLTAQTINVPVAAGTSAHLVGGVLLAWTLGPGQGAWTMAIVLGMQALLLGDGGAAAWGANVLNMALAPAGIVAVARRLSPSITKAGLAAALAVPLAAALIVIETAAFRPLAELTGWAQFAALMLGTHVGVGVLEGALTAGLLAAFSTRSVLRPLPRRAVFGFTVAMLIAAFVLPISSSLPDGYEAAAQASGLAWLLAP
jgi:cobalt/nickel transport system permease protein